MIIIAVIVCLMPFCMRAGAASPSGEITVIMINKADKSPLKNNKISIARVADCDYSPSRISFALNDDFSDSRADLTDTSAARILYATAQSKGIKGASVTSDAEGKAVYPCPLGAYLVWSPESIFNPFVVFVPYETDDEIIFNVTAEPKIDIPVTEPDKPTEPTKPTEPDKPTEPTKPDEPTAPTSPTVPPVTVIRTTTTTAPANPGGGPGTPGHPTTPNTPNIPIITAVTNEHTTRPHTTSDNGRVTSPDEDTDTTSTTKEKLPQTGMVQYPIPILGFAGILMFAIGFIVYGEGKKKEN